MLEPSLRRRLERLYGRHRGACARLAGMGKTLRPPTPRQDKFLAAAIVEAWSYHLLKAGADLPLPHPLAPQLTYRGAQWPRLEPQLANWPLAWPALADQDLTLSQSYGGRTLRWAQASLYHQGQNLGWLSRERLNYLYLEDPEAQPHYWTLKMGEAIPRLTKTRRLKRLLISPRSPQWETLEEAWRAAVGEGSALRLVTSSSLLAKWLARLDSASLELPLANSRSRLLLLEEKPLSQRDWAPLIPALERHLGIPTQRCAALWAWAQARLILWGWPQGGYAWPHYLRLTPPGGICHPLNWDFPLLNSQPNFKLKLKFSTLCGLNGPQLEIET